jgi:hypothetical protein
VELRRGLGTLAGRSCLMPMPIATGAGATRNERTNPLNRAYGYHLAKREAKVIKALAGGPLLRRIAKPPAAMRSIDVHLMTFSGERDAAEQLVSLRSFVRSVGMPTKLTIGSDGTHSPRTLQLLRRMVPHVAVVPPREYLARHLPLAVRTYAATHPLGKKLAFLVSSTIDEPTIYSDSDILFFSNGSLVHDLVEECGDHPRFLLDCAHSLDERVLPPGMHGLPPVNSGFMALGNRLAWDKSIERLGDVDDYRFHTEQSVIHVAMHLAHGAALDPELFLMRVDDRFRHRTTYETSRSVLRHYVSNIRHHFWLNAFR